MRYVLGIMIAVLVVCGAMASPFVHEPYSGAPAEDSVTISWASMTPLPARIEYGSLEHFENQQQLQHSIEVGMPEEGLSDTQHVVLEGLPSSDQYAYRVVLIDGETEYASDVREFCTAPAPGTAINFIVLSDTQQQLEGENRLELVGNAVAADPMEFEFILHAGDIVESPSSFYWDDWFTSFSDMLARAPFIPVPGNHEKNHRTYYDNFEFPPGAGKNDERWWALHWGDVVVVGIDTNVRSATDIRLQQDWAREHLGGSEPHKFVIFHHPVFTSDAGYGTSFFFDSIYHPIFVEMNADIVFNGHSHHYERIVRDGVTYMVVGGGGATPRQTRPDHIDGSDVSVEGHHFYVRVATSDEGIRVETVSVARETGTAAIATGGQLLDAFQLLLPLSELPATRSSTLLWVVAFGMLFAISLSGTWIYVKRRNQQTSS